MNLLQSDRFQKKNDYKKIKYDQSLKDFLKDSDELFIIQDDKEYSDENPQIILIVRKTSNRRKKDSFCGAGHEDYLALIGLDRNVLKIHDKILIQSCLKSISLISDEGDNPEKAIKITSQPLSIKYSVTSSPNFEIKKYHIEIKNKKFEKNIDSASIEKN